MTLSSHVVDHLTADQRRQLRDLTNEYRATNEAWNDAQASIIRARKLNEISYHRKRKQILSNGHESRSDHEDNAQ